MIIFDECANMCLDRETDAEEETVRGGHLATADRTINMNADMLSQSVHARRHQLLICRCADAFRLDGAE